MALLKKIVKKEEKKIPVAKVPAKKSADDEIAIAIATAIFLHTQQQIHDTENSKMTIQRIDKPYSPWSSKNHMMRKWPHRK